MQQLDNQPSVEFAMIDSSNLKIFLNLSQCYEAEFSNLTLSMPDRNGLFEIATMPNLPYIGYIIFVDNVPIGFCVANIGAEFNDIADFYIIPSMRKRAYGYKLAEFIFKLHPGKWHVRQIEGANGATLFWRKVIGKYTNGDYEESLVTDKDWGVVTRQTFAATT